MGFRNVPLVLGVGHGNREQHDGMKHIVMMSIQTHRGDILFARCTEALVGAAPANPSHLGTWDNFFGFFKKT
ncbi:MAG: hypothetical protein NVS9B4_05800 [Candidatus Acidiferrum sp.]